MRTVIKITNNKGWIIQHSTDAQLHTDLMQWCYLNKVDYSPYASNIIQEILFKNKVLFDIFKLTFDEKVLINQQTCCVDYARY